MKRLVLFMMAVMLLSIIVNAQKKGGKTLVAYFSATGTTARAAKLVQKLSMGLSTKYSLRKSTRLLIWTGTTKLRAAVWRCRIPNRVLHCILNWGVSRSMIPFISVFLFGGIWLQESSIHL